MRASLFTVLSRRIRHDEAGFSLVEVVVAMGVILLSLTMLATTSLVGFKGAATARGRQSGTALADQLVEQVRALPFWVITEGMKDSDLTGDTSIVSCSGTYKLKSCSGEAIVHASGVTTASPLYPHRATIGPPTYPNTYTTSVYLTYANGNPNLYRLTVEISWPSGGSISKMQTQTLLSNPASSGDSSTQVSSGGAVASYYGVGSVSPGNVIVTPNAAVYNGVGVTGLTWSLGDSMRQRMYSLDANVAQGQAAKVDGQSTLTAVEKSLSGVVTASGGSSTYSTADDDTSTTGVGTSSAPTAISQTGPSVSVTGGGNSLLTNQYGETTTTTTTAGDVTRRSYASSTSNTSSISIAKPAGLVLGDLMIAQFSYQTTTTSTCMSTPTTNGEPWTLVRCDVSGSDPRMWSAIFSKWATATDVAQSSFSFTTNATSGVVGGIMDYYGLDQAAPVNASASSTGSSSSATTPIILKADYSTNNAGLLAFFAARGNTTVTPAASQPGTDPYSPAWSGIGGLDVTRSYLTNAPALSATAGSGTVASGNTQSATFVLAKTFERTVGVEPATGSNAWPLTVSVATASIATEYEYRFRLVRKNSAGVQQSASGYSTVFTGTGTKSFTFTWDPGTWQVGDKLAVEWEHRRVSGTGNKTSTIYTTSASYVDAPPGQYYKVGGAAASGDKSPRGAGQDIAAWTATLGRSDLWVAQMLILKPGDSTTTTTTTGDPGTENGSTVSTVTAAASPVCGSPAQADGRPCAYATQSYTVPVGFDGAFLSTTVDLAGYGVGACHLYRFGPPSGSPTSYAYGRRMTASGNERVKEAVTRYYGTHTFGGMCSGTGSTPSQWPGYFVKFDAGTSASAATTDAGAVAAPTTSTTTVGTITVWNGSGTTSFTLASLPSSGTWSTNPTSVDFTSGSGYRYQISATLASGQTYATSSSSCTAGCEAKAVVGSPVIGTIAYKLTDQSTSRVLIDVTISVDLGSLVAQSKFTPAAA